MATKRLIRRKTVEDKTGLSRSGIYDLVKAGRFPQPVPIGAKAVAWIEAEVDAWINERIAARDTAAPEVQAA